MAFAIHHGFELADLPPEIDHMDTVESHNWIDNLRPANRNENMHNVGKAKNNTSGFKGVSWHSSNQKWAANIRVNKRKIHIGYFNDPEGAHAAYVAAANDKFGEFARAA
ncbi:AP2 domain-containing protein [Mesorhizobium sp.]|uniref:AP2 domain-containing protein n=1 Tax=Mesorhizobium sp. TaxID=1871066 RepID=UPI00257F21F4|nr:AP2 domain-containing protein [Mesorhizobium sp.]